MRVLQHGERVRYNGNVYYVVHCYEDYSGFLSPTLDEWTLGRAIPPQWVIFTRSTFKDIKPFEREVKGFAKFIKHVEDMKTVPVVGSQAA